MFTDDMDRMFDRRQDVDVICRERRYQLAPGVGELILCFEFLEFVQGNRPRVKIYEVAFISLFDPMVELMIRTALEVPTCVRDVSAEDDTIEKLESFLIAVPELQLLRCAGQH